MLGMLLEGLEELGEEGGRWVNSDQKTRHGREKNGLGQGSLPFCGLREVVFPTMYLPPCRP